MVNKQIVILSLIGLAILIVFFILLKNIKPSSFALAPTTTTTGSNIIIFSPKPNSLVNGDIIVKGVARVFENQLDLRLIDPAGSVIFNGSATTTATSAGAYGNFQKTISLPLAITSNLPATSTLILQVFNYSAKDGREIDKVTIPLRFNLVQLEKVKIFFSNSNLNPEISCAKVFPVKRWVKKSQGIDLIVETLVKLLQGPTSDEKIENYSTNIPIKTIIKSVEQNSSTIRIDFNQALDQNIGGSCRIEAIRAQIIKTVEQFPGVNNVIISINSQTKNILQP
ncbi:MAG: GerMN domain-containing protein [Patescibacteria group bacterium]|nr:GerMN domain-containing protein [Patescibacteria group bacterium]